jgi:hypothetical protein
MVRRNTRKQAPDSDRYRGIVHSLVAILLIDTVRLRGSVRKASSEDKSEDTIVEKVIERFWL